MTITTTPGIRDGYYTVCFKNDTDHGHRTFRIRTQPVESDFAPGKQVISYLMGSDNTSDYRSMAIVAGNRLQLWKKYQGKQGADISTLVKCAELLVSGAITDKAGRMYARESGNCYRCNRLLTEPESIRLGIGPVCRGKE